MWSGLVPVAVKITDGKQLRGGKYITTEAEDLEKYGCSGPLCL